MNVATKITEIRKFVLPEIIFGTESRFLTGKYAKNLGMKHPLIVTGKELIQIGWVNEIAQSLTENQLEYKIFSDISPNPRDYEVDAGAEFYIKNKCDSIIAIGGGSVMDCAKGIGILCSNGSKIYKYEGVDKVQIPMPPLICLPTTAGTSADVSQFAIINYTEKRIKIAIISKSVIPDLSIIDPEMLLSMSPYLTACTGMDALCHAFEAFVSNASSHITDIHCTEAIRLITRSLTKSIEHPDDIELRAEVMLGSMYAGMAFSNASLGCVHALAHSLGGYFDLPHGECNAILLPHVVDFNYNKAENKYKQINIILNLPVSNSSDENKMTLMKYVNDMKMSVGIERTFAFYGIKRSETAILAENAVKDPCNATNPRTPTEKDLEIILLESL